MRGISKRELRSLHARLVDAQEAERKRLARDLHDGICQLLSGIKFRLGALSDTVLSQPEKARAGIVQAEESLALAISEIRRVSQDLLPSELEDLGLRPALVALCRDFRERLGIPVIVRCSGAPKEIAPRLSLALFRVAQEALSNVGKHARATQATLSLRRKGRSIELEITDDGRGRGARRKAAGRRGMGLRSIRERVESVGGTADFRSEAGRGTRLVILAPLALREKEGR